MEYVLYRWFLCFVHAYGFARFSISSVSSRRLCDFRTRGRRSRRLRVRFREWPPRVFRVRLSRLSAARGLSRYGEGTTSVIRIREANYNTFALTPRTRARNCRNVFLSLTGRNTRRDGNAYIIFKFLFVRTRSRLQDASYGWKRALTCCQRSAISCSAKYRPSRAFVSSVVGSLCVIVRTARERKNLTRTKTVATGNKNAARIDVGEHKQKNIRLRTEWKGGGGKKKFFSIRFSVAVYISLDVLLSKKLFCFVFYIYIYE